MPFVYRMLQKCKQTIHWCMYTNNFNIAENANYIQTKFCLQFTPYSNEN